MAILPNTLGTAQFRFVTPYFLLGCGSPQFLVVDLNRPAQYDLLALLLIPDIEDIVQDIFDPSGGRNSGPERRGRKRNRRTNRLSIDSLISRPIRQAVNPHNILGRTVARYIFPIWNLYEGVNFTFAIIDSVNDVLFENLLGVFEANQNECLELVRMVRKSTDNHVRGGVDDGIKPVPCQNLITQNGMSSSAGFTTTEVQGTCAFSCAVTNPFDNPVRGYIAVGPDIHTELGRSQEVTLTKGETVYLTCGADNTEPAIWVWGWRNLAGNFVECFDATAIVFGDVGTT